jgi:mono/diheme cytochrome c family protein
MQSLLRAGIMKPVLAWLGILAVLGVFVALAAVYSGAFNVAATVTDAAPLRWVLVTTREASIKRHAQGIRVPTLGGAQQLENGFRIYREMCAICHTPVGRTETPIAIGLNPQAPGFEEDADHMSAADLFWVIKNGIRFTGMPAWGLSRSDQELWDVVAFLVTLPKMNAADYDAMDRRVASWQALQR